MATVYVTAERFNGHTFAGHPENAARLETIHRAIDGSDIAAHLERIAPVRASDEQILAVHTPEYLDVLHYTETLHDGRMLTPDTYVMPESFEIARYSAGGGIAAVDAIIQGKAANGLVITRPPGHHATPSHGMGFCLLSNIAITARYAQSAYRAQGIERILIVDYDVHHGNGTQDVFYTDPSVLFISTHQWPWYPGTGAAGDIGVGSGVGTTVNIPLGAGAGDGCFAAAYNEIVWPVARRFAPNLILVSAGFDAHWRESRDLGQLRLSLAGYIQLSAELKRMADELCDGRIAFVLEGGYNLAVLGQAAVAVARVLLGETEIADTLGTAPSQMPAATIAPLLDELKRIHRI